MKDFIILAVKIIVAFLIAIVIINDIGVIIINRVQAGEAAKKISDEAKIIYETSNDEFKSYQTALNIANKTNVTIEGFKIADGKIQLWIKMPPKRTFLAHRIKSLEEILNPIYKYSFNL